MGLVKTLIAAEDAAAFPDLLEELAARAAWVAPRVRDDGLWDNFLDEPGHPPDASGSCGIACALLLAQLHGWVKDDYRPLANATWQGLRAHLAPDGLLASVAPNNKRGEAAQHTDRRTCEPFAQGLMGQLAAARMAN